MGGKSIKMIGDLLKALYRNFHTSSKIILKNFKQYGPSLSAAE